MTSPAEALALVRDKLGGEWKSTVCVNGDQVLVISEQRGEFAVVGLAPALVENGEVQHLSSSPLSWPAWYLDTDDADLTWVSVDG